MRTELDCKGDTVYIYNDWEEFYKMHPDVKNTLGDRQKTHGDFTDNARVTQEMKLVLRCESTWKDLTFDQREAIEMIMLKIGRIVTGNPNESDHWLDIEGYARLARERLEK